jgi:hypothetical protein
MDSLLESIDIATTIVQDVSKLVPSIIGILLQPLLFMLSWFLISKLLVIIAPIRRTLCLLPGTRNMSAGLHSLDFVVFSLSGAAGAFGQLYWTILSYALRTDLRFKALQCPGYREMSWTVKLATSGLVMLLVLEPMAYVVGVLAGLTIQPTKVADHPKQRKTK